jgi:hypothetical protein
VVKLYTSADNYLAEHHAENSEGFQTGSKNAHRLFSIKFDKNNQDVFYTGGWDRNVKIWDLRLKNGIVSTIYGNLNICADGIDVKVIRIFDRQFEEKLFILFLFRAILY